MLYKNGEVMWEMLSFVIFDSFEYCDCVLQYK